MRTCLKLEENLGAIQEEITGMKAHWQNEKDLIQEIRKIKEEREQLSIEEQQAEREGKLSRVAEIRYGKSAELQNGLNEINLKLFELQKTRKMLKEELDEEDVAEVISRWTGIPVSKMLEGEREKLINMEELLGRWVIGQN